ncbi:MAG: glycosyltransferase family 4 protein [Candidatus Zixiibacteriota bacterium]
MESNRKITVCHIISGDLWAGAEAQAFTMMSALHEVPDVELSAIVLNHGKLARRLKECSIPVTVIDESKYSFLQIVKIATELLSSRGARIVHSHRYKENIIAALIKKREEVEFLVQTVHGVQERFNGIKSLKVAVYGRLNQYFTRKYFDKILPVSKDISNRLLGIYGADKITNVPNAIDIERVKPSSEPATVKEHLGINPNEIVIGTVGRMVPIKGLEIFLKVAKQILSARGDVRFVLVGDGPETERLKKLAGEEGISERVMFTGFRDDVLDLTNSFDIFMMTSWHEGIPVALLEAMALSKPTVATRVGGIGEVIEDNKSGCLAEAGNVVELASATSKLLESRELRVNIGRQAFARVSSEFSTTIQRERLANIYRLLCK